MIWVAEYKDGTILNEEKDDFYDIEREKIESFSLEGKAKFKHLVNEGKMIVNENDVTFSFNDTKLGFSNDIINYKEAMESLEGKTIVGYYTGWKEEIEDGFIELLFWVDLKEQSLKIRLRVTPKNISEGIFKMSINDKNIKRKLKLEDQRNQFVFKL
jgi:hypothetical protein